jgi:hypothetical protein
VACPGVSPAQLREHLTRFDDAVAALTQLTDADDDATAAAAWAQCTAAFHDGARWLWDELARSR